MDEYRNLTLGQLKNERKQLKAEARDILDAAEAQGDRDLTDAEAEKFDELYEELLTIETRIEEKTAWPPEDRPDDSPDARQAFVGVAMRDRIGGDAPAVHSETRDSAMSYEDTTLSQDEYRALDAFLRHGDNAETREAVQSIGTAAEGGVFASTILASNFLDIQQEFGGVRDSRALQIRTETGESMKRPFRDDVQEQAEQVAENSTVTSVGKMDFGSVKFEAFTMDSGIITLSREQIQDSRQDIVDIVMDGLGRRVARKVQGDIAGSTNTSSTSINGVVTGSSGAVTMGAGSSNLDIQTFRDLRKSLDPAYRRNAEWLLDISAADALLDLEDGDGEPLIQPSLQEGEPDQLLGDPIVTVVGMGDIGTSTEFPILYGDFRQGFGIRDVKTVELVRYDEKFAPSRRVGFQAFARHDARPLFSSTVSSTNRPYRAVRTT